MDRFTRHYNNHNITVDLDSIIRVFANGKVKDTLPAVIKIAAEDHKYLPQWKAARWDVNTIHGLITLIKKYELNDLQLQGKAIWALEKVLKYGGKESPELQEMRYDEILVQFINETLFQILLEYTVYNRVIDILRILVQDYGFLAGKMFEIGSTLIDKIPGLINDDCYIALIHFASDCSRSDSSSVTQAMAFLANTFSLIGCDSNANYFLYRCREFLKLGLTIDQSEYFHSLQESEDIKREMKDKTITYTLMLLRNLATIQPTNAKYLFQESDLFSAIVRTITERDLFLPHPLFPNNAVQQNPNHLQLSPREIVVREALLTMIALIVSPMIRAELKNVFTHTLLIEMIEWNYLGVNEIIVDLYLQLYESDLPYLYEEQKYSPAGSVKDQQLLRKLFQSIVTTLETIFRPASGKTAIMEGKEVKTDIPASFSEEGNSSRPITPPPSASFLQQDEITSTKIIQCNFIYRTLFKLESSLHIVSDITQFIDEKLQLLQILLPIFQSKPPNAWNLYYINILDIIFLLFKGCEYCWEVPKLDLLDAEFLHISNQLMNQFGQDPSLTQPLSTPEAAKQRKVSTTDGKKESTVSITANPPSDFPEEDTTDSVLNNNRFFDNKDRNSLYYLIGYDNLSTIPTIVRRSIDHPDEDSVSISSSSASPSKPRPLSRKNTFSREEEDREKQEEGKGSTAKNPNENPLQQYYDTTLHPMQMQKYEHCLQLFKSFKQYLLSHLSWIETLVVNWELHSIETNCRKLLFFYALCFFLEVPLLMNKIVENPLLYDLLWRLINQQQPNSSSSTSKLPIHQNSSNDGKSGAAGKKPRGKATDNLYNIKMIYGMNRKCIQLLTILIREKGSFDQSVHFAEFLHLILTTRPERLRDITTNSPALHVGDYPGANPDTEEDPTGGGGGRMDGDDTEFSDELLLQSRDNVSIFANLAFRMSSVDLLSLIESPTTPVFADLAGTSPSQLSSLPNTGSAAAVVTQHPMIVIEDIVNMDIHYTAVSAMLVLSHFDRTVRRKMINYATNIVESLNFICPNDPICAKPMIYLVKSMMEFIAKLELVNEETFIGLVIRGLQSPLYYIQSQTCDLIYSIGMENPGFIYRGLSRNEIEGQLLSMFRESQPENVILVLHLLKASCVIIHNINLKPVWIPVPWLSHWSKYPKNNTPVWELIQDREFISVKTLLLILSLLKTCPKEYRLVYFTYILTFGASLMYACVDGIIPNAGAPPSSPNNLLHNTISSPEKTGSPPSQYIRDALIQYQLPLLPIAIDLIMTLGKKFNKQRKSVTEVENPIRSVSSSTAGKGGVGEEELGSNRREPGSPSSALGLGMVTEAYSQILANRYYHNNDKKFNLSLLLQEFQQRESISGIGGSSSLSASLGDGQLTPSQQLLQLILEEKLLTSTYAFIQDQTTYYPAAIGRSRSVSAVDYAGSSSASASRQKSSSPLPPAISTSALPATNETTMNSSSSNKKLTPTQLLSIVKSKPIEKLTEKTIDCIYSFLCTDEMFPLSTYLQYLSLFETNPLIASISYFMTEYRHNSLILKRGIECLRYFADNQMQLSLIAMHSPLALLYTYRQMKDIQEIQFSFVKILYQITQTQDDFAKENILRFNLHLYLIEMMSLPQYELTKIALQCILGLLINEQAVLTMVENTPLMESLLQLLDSMIKDIKIQYYGMKIILTIDSYAPEIIPQLAKQKHKNLFPIMKKSRKLLIHYMKTNYQFYYQNNIFQKTLMNLGNGGKFGFGMMGEMLDGSGSGGSGGENGYNSPAGGAKNVTNAGISPGGNTASAMNDSIERNDIEELLNDPIWQKAKCVIM